MKTFHRIQENIVYPTDDRMLVMRSIDMHTGGEPLRVILEGFPPLMGSNVLEYRHFIKAHYDQLRTALMFEPRGHADMYGCVLTPPNDDGAEFGIIFMHNEGYSTMCGHAIIAISTLAAQMNWIDTVEGENIMKIDAPCGRLSCFITIKNGHVAGVRFHGVPSFVVGLDRTIEIEGLGEVTYDLAYGGTFYAYVDMAKNNFDFDLSADSYRDLIATGMQIKNSVIKNDKEILHPFENDLSFLYGTIFIGDPHNKAHDSRNVCIFAEGEVDRCPTGSGIAGRMAIHHKRGEIEIGEKMSVESITDSLFYGSIVSEENYGPYSAVIPQVEGTAHICGQHTFIIDPEDPMRGGFILR
jgi:trans-L-3-hydroxyproline dehydratase